MPRRRRKVEEEENLERWLVSYADFITLLFAFFVVMYSISSVNDGKYRVVSDSLVKAFSEPQRSMELVQIGEILKGKPSADILGIDLNSTDKFTSPFPIDAEEGVLAADGDEDSTGDAAKMKFLNEEMQKEDEGPKLTKEESEKLQQVANAIENSLGYLVLKDLVAVQKNKFWIEVDMKSSLLFPSGSSTIAKPAVDALEKVAIILKPLNNPIYVEGFTDNVPINTRTFPSNWELSAARAANVVHQLTKQGINPKRLAAIGFGEYRPIASNLSAEGRNKNRRVMLLIMAESQENNTLLLKDTMGVQNKNPTNIQDRPFVP